MFAKETPFLEQTGTIKSDVQPAIEKIKLIDEYQEKYFKIIKRNDVLLNLEDTEELNKDRYELENLFKEVENQIKNNRMV